MFRFVYFVFFLFFIVLVSLGCSRQWKGTKNFYGTYINKPACIDYGDKGSLNYSEQIFVIRMMGIDIQLENLMRYLQNNDRMPSDKSIFALLTKFPWLSGVAFLEPDGQLLIQEPKSLLKEYDFSSILKAKARDGLLGSIRASVQNTLSGPQVFISVPIYIDLEMKGFFVVYFDMAKLVTYSPYARDIVVFSPDTVLWSGQFSFNETPMYDENWSVILRNFVNGKLSNRNGEFLWLVHYIGEQKIIFSTPISGEFFERTKECAIDNEFIKIIN